MTEVMTYSWDRGLTDSTLVATNSLAIRSKLLAISDYGLMKAREYSALTSAENLPLPSTAPSIHHATKPVLLT
jgi:hypothetical protein